VPNPIVRQGVVTAVTEFKDLNQDEVALRFRWFVNGTPVSGETSSTFNPERFKRGDRVSVEATPFDGKTSGQPVRTAEVLVGNTVPVVQSVMLEPKEPKVGERIKVALEGSDVDGDEVRYSYKWWRNNQVVLDGEQNTLDTTGYSRDDTVTVAIVPHDREGAGKEVRSQPVTFSNSPPKFTSSVPAAISQGQLDYTVTASDAENDPLTFSLETAPPGMTIDERTGRLQWVVPPSSNGAFRVKVVVRDDHQGWAFQEFDLTPKNPAAS
jgi:hypothetical protein